MKNELSVHHQLSFREKLIIFLFDHSKNIYRVLIKRNKKSWALSIPKLLEYENGTLGKDLGLFLRENDFELEPKFEKHDIYHLLTDYNTDVVGEICLSIFNVANGKRSIYTIGVAIMGFLIMMDEYKTFKLAFQRGKNARSYAYWKFQHLLNENTQELKKYIFREENDLEVFI